MKPRSKKFSPKLGFSPTNENENGFKTSADTAYEIICNKIIMGELEPGAKLTRRKMAELTGVSIIPVIEALHRLENEGLVDSEPHFGSKVIQLTEETIRDKFAMRLAVECQVARILAKHCTDEQARHLLFLSDELDHTPRDVEHQSILWDKHYTFHLTMSEFTECRSLIQALRRLNLFDLLQKTILSFSATHKEVPENHHKKIIIAIQSGDSDHAERTIREHIYFSGLLNPDQV